jgi:hypothetical protein
MMAYKVVQEHKPNREVLQWVIDELVLVKLDLVGLILQVFDETIDEYVEYLFELRIMY